mmetsp:Transcript_31764/g.38377  ORF Transcript_31764/g.38377 Transcript_31764/m.38377 type:complete len:234 (-) Transcript_31764:363-1064(-)|eukprot:CAMPEP_0197847842 /NCGR_PEP_ID=MMETSP1438-20131217/7254_1 /TAXON_ID=1461541 /ORGANISM="Pterosperma sp., Strain CCMP1384" /LENGTH=233 /DNA_ID=CAMNT_0043459881 /DNA_START=89 /DNA_END=790 /DNA_ORIENTATION=+
MGKGPLDTSEGSRCGVQRQSQANNVLLVPAELGKVKRTTVSLPAEDFAYGLSKPRDPEGAREVSMKWVEHRPNPDAKPGPDFMQMNKHAAISEVTKANGQRDFRTENPKTLKTGEHAETRVAKGVPLPSEINSDHTYGRQSSCRPVEETRLTGAAPHIKNVIQGSFANDWISMNDKRAGLFEAQNSKIPPQATKASSGHASRAKAALDEGEKEPWKMKKFQGVESKVKQMTQG